MKCFMPLLNAHRRSALVAALVVLASAAPASAVSITKSNTVDALNLTTSWAGELVPGGADIAVWDGTESITNAWLLGAATSWDGMQVSNAVANTATVTINNDGNSLTLGASGVDLNFAGRSAALATPVVLGANQTWSVTNTRTLTVSGNISDAGGSYSLSKAGGGTVTLSGTNTYPGITTVGAGTLRLNKTVSLYNNTPANWTDANITVNSGSTMLLNFGGTGEFASADVATLAALGTGSGGFLSGSTLGFDTGTVGAVGATTNSASISNPNGGANILGVLKQGNGRLVQTGASTYTGGATVTGGTLLADSGAGLPTASALTLNGGLYAALNGSIVRSVGASAGQVSIPAGTSGFNAIGTNTTVALGGLATPSVLTWGSATFNPGTFVLNDTNATADITLLNRIDIGTNRTVSVGAGTVTLVERVTNSASTIAIFNKIGNGTLVVSNALTFAGTNINYYNCPQGNQQWKSTLKILMPESPTNLVGMIRNLGTNAATIIVQSSPTTTNYYYGWQQDNQGPVLKNVDGGVMRIEGGTWVLPNLGQNNSSAQMRGTNYFTNTTVLILTNDFVKPTGNNTGLRYTVGSYFLQNGANLIMRAGDRFSLGEEQLLTRTNFFLDIANGAALDVCHSQNGVRLGGAAGTVAYVNQTGGSVRLGIAPSLSTLTATNRNITIGNLNGAGATAYYNLAGGTLAVGGTIQSGGLVSSNAFFFNGGILSCLTFNTANFANMSDGALVNNGGAFAPGETNTAGYMIVNGSAIMNANATLAVDVGGTNATPAGRFQTNLAGFYDYFQVTNSLVIDGSLVVNLINGFVPAPSDSFEVVHLNLSGTNTIAGTFTNLVTGGPGLGRVAIANQPGATFRVDTNIASKSIILTDYSSGATAPPVASFSGTPTSGVRPLTVTFTNTSTGSFTNGLWIFGDGTTNSTAALEVAHTYTQEGSYDVTLIAEGDGGFATNTQLAYITVTVPGAPTVTSVTRSGSDLIVQGTGGPTGGGYNYWLLSATNVTLPRASWTVLATNTFNVDGTFSNSTPVTVGERQRYFQLQMP